jgi:type III restriction enzyme
VVETKSGKFICEVNARKDLETDDVRAKQQAAVSWCAYANEATGAMWSYVLIPHDAISDNQSFLGICAQFLVKGT